VKVRIGRAGCGLLLSLLPVVAAAAAIKTGDPAGLWLTQDRGGVISVARCGPHLCARIAGVVLDQPSDPMPVDYQGTSQCGLELISDAAEVKPNLWRGHIRDPRNGSVWSVQIWVNPDGTFALRGFLGVSVLGRTETWTRYRGVVPADCRLSPADIVAVAPPAK
jgi:uncharacterized protein (DUF2147 family)